MSFLISSYETLSVIADYTLAVISVVAIFGCLAYGITKKIRGKS